MGILSRNTVEVKYSPDTLVLLTMFYQSCNDYITIDTIDKLIEMAENFEKTYGELRGRDWERSKIGWEETVRRFYNKKKSDNWNEQIGEGF